ncbi:MAG: hypothetical protein HXY24_10385, partial [Rubrivivax sp.]|nr:hypothetical protein [Rubrivivax sp.]
MMRLRRDVWLNRFFLSLLIVGAAFEAGAAAPLGGKLVQLQGQVTVRRAGAQDWQPAHLNQELFAGDAVQTGPISRAAILSVDESQIKL